MPSDFMRQFQAGWQMGQGKNENRRRDLELQMEQQRQQQEQERRAAAFQLQQEEFKLRKKQLAAEEHASRLAAAKEAFQMRTEAASMQNLPPPSAADVGVPEQGPEMAGPSPSQINVPQPMQAMPNPMEGQADIQMPVLTGRQQQAEQQKKLREALGMLEAKAGIEAAYRKPEAPRSVSPGGVLVDESGKVIFRNPKAEGEGGKKPLSQQAESNVINRLSGQWAAATKTAGDIDRQVSIMETGLAAARRGDMAAGSQAVLVTFQKILDPTSVVRESEYARSASGQALLARMKGAVEQLQKGGAGVPVSQLEKFAQVAREMAKGTRGHLDATKERIGKVADRYNIPRELVIENYDYGSQPQPTQPGGIDPEVERRLKALGY